MLSLEAAKGVREQVYSWFHDALYFKLGEWDVTFEMLAHVSGAINNTPIELIENLRYEDIRRFIRGDNPTIFDFDTIQGVASPGAPYLLREVGDRLNRWRDHYRKELRLT